MFMAGKKANSRPCREAIAAMVARPPTNPAGASNRPTAGLSALPVPAFAGPLQGRVGAQYLPDGRRPPTTGSELNERWKDGISGGSRFFVF
jgi:hypothetical protein